ncbi:MAG: hypothetical protein J6Q85_00325 [Clostridia bacterium]|nr:hypothetical protein [Clostridia bacterium]
MSKISLYHLYKLIFRSIALGVALTLYIYNLLTADKTYEQALKRPAVLLVVWGVFAVEIFLRLFPSRTESMGCQKQFLKNYKPKPLPPDRQSFIKTFIMAMLWLAADGTVVLLYLFSVIDAGLVVLYCLFLSVLDIICILFFCPFQTFVMKNKCCATCRIYNWDYIMMFSPLFFIPSFFTVSIAALSLVLFLEWEIIYRLHPERFCESANASLDCENCKEKLCAHKTQLRKFLKSRKRKNQKRNENSEICK